MAHPIEVTDGTFEDEVVKSDITSGGGLLG